MIEAYVKLAAWITIAFLVGFVNRRWLFYFLVIGGVFESIIGFLQFLNHKDLGLQWLGESVLRPENLEIARTYLGENSGLLLRAYGTFPHPNILAAFLILALLAGYWLFVSQKSKVKNQNDKSKLKNLGIVWLMVNTIVIFIVWLGLILTFSRAGWLIAVLMTAGFMILNKIFRKSDVSLLIIIAVILIVLISIFHWAIISRLTTFSVDNFTVQERLSDYQLAWQLIKERPWFGHGLTLALPAGEGGRPIHNLYLTIIVEIGLVGLMVFLVFMGWVYWKAISSFRNLDPGSPAHIATQNVAGGESGMIKVVALLMLTSLLMYGLFDHFLWTLRPGLGMFWVVVGMLL